jgi:hypothetical protein
MKTKKQTLFSPARLVSLALLIALSAVLLPSGVVTPTRAQTSTNNPKVSDDLEDVVLNQPSVTHVNSVIIVPGSTPTSSLLSYLATIGATVKGQMKNMPVITIKLPVKQIFSCAARSDVSYITMDRDTRKQGHLDITTGASIAVKGTNIPGGGVSGSGIGIAILPPVRGHTFDPRG